jgi:hypothetical protein
VADLFHAVPGYTRYIYDTGREPLFFLLLAFLLMFVTARTYARIGRTRGWRSGSVGGAHLHHLVPGVIASLFAGTAIIAFRPGDDSMLLLSVLFGVGSALILDEFALILHLDDVYWTAEGRSSIEAALMGFSFGALCLLAAAPVGSDPGQDIPHWAIAGVLSVNLAFALICFLKGKPRLGVVGIFIPGVAAVGAARLGLPSSLWARRWYRDAKLEESRQREETQDRRYVQARHRIYDLIGGAPHLDRGRQVPPPSSPPRP